LRTGEPFAYVSLGTFLSARADVLARVVSSLRLRGMRAAVATGVAAPPPVVPDGWLARPFLPQVELIAHADVVVTHGGNNSVTEALTAGRPQLVLPLSTDQFAIAADVERTGVGRSADPNRASPAALAAALDEVVDPAVRRHANAVGDSLRARPGARLAVDAVTAVDARATTTRRS
jgi:UDP:flavonoid glycosyltransferase YjiC (YdhE family)